MFSKNDTKKEEGKLILLNLDGFVKSIEMEKNDLIYELMQKEEFKILNKFLEYMGDE